MGIQAVGYMVEAEWDGSMLRARGTKKMSQVALAGEDHASGDVVIPAEQIANVQLKRANALVNGNLVVTTTEGRKYQLHFRKKTADQFDVLYEALSSRVSQG